MHGRAICVQKLKAGREKKSSAKGTFHSPIASERPPLTSPSNDLKLDTNCFSDRRDLKEVLKNRRYENPELTKALDTLPASG